MFYFSKTRLFAGYRPINSINKTEAFEWTASVCYLQTYKDIVDWIFASYNSFFRQSRQILLIVSIT